MGSLPTQALEGLCRFLLAHRTEIDPLSCCERVRSLPITHGDELDGQTPQEQGLQKAGGTENLVVRMGRHHNHAARVNRLEFS